MAQLDANWLQNEMFHVVVDCAAGHDPQVLAQITAGPNFPIPLGQRETDALYRRLVTRFREWTGHDITTYAPKAPTP